MISTKEAASKAIEKMKEYFPDAINVRLEEIEVHNKEIWATLSFEISEKIPELDWYQKVQSGLSLNNPLPGFRMVRIFRIFKINAENGAFISMHHSTIEV